MLDHESFFFWGVWTCCMVGSCGIQGDGLSTSRCILQCQTWRATSRCFLYIDKHKNKSGPEGIAGPSPFYTASEVQLINHGSKFRSLSQAGTLTIPRSVWNIKEYKLIKRPGHNVQRVCNWSQELFLTCCFLISSTLSTTNPLSKILQRSTFLNSNREEQQLVGILFHLQSLDFV